MYNFTKFQITNSDLLGNFLGVLRSLRYDDATSRVGICWSVCSRTRVSLSQLKYYFERWPKFSGDYDYPVPAPNLQPDVAYYRLPLWDTNIPYGRNRFELLDFMIKEVEKQLNTGRSYETS